MTENDEGEESLFERVVDEVVEMTENDEGEE